MTRFAPLLALLLAGCSVPTSVGELQSSVQGGGSSTGNGVDPSTGEDDPVATTADEDAASSSGSSTGSDALVPEMGAFVIRWGDIPEDEDDTDTVNTGVGTGSEWDPDAILVQVGLSVSSCEDVFASDPCGTWHVSFTLEPDQQVEGSFDGSEINATYSEIGPGDDPNDCMGYGGGSFDATVIVESIDDSGLQIRFENVSFPILDVDLEGFEAFVPRC